MSTDDHDRAERLLSMIEEAQHNGNQDLNDMLSVLMRMEARQKKELESIRFNTGWCLYVLIFILVSLTTGWFWESW